MTEGGQAAFAQEGGIVDFVDAHVRPSGYISAFSDTQVRAPLRDNLTRPRHRGDSVVDHKATFTFLVS